MFQPLTIASVKPQTAQAVQIDFALPPEQREAFRFVPGQFLTLRANIEGQDARRSYSICSGVDELGAGRISVGIKRVEGGLFSNWAQSLKPGQRIEVMKPEGRFGLKAAAAGARHHLLIAAGSGITPMLSILRSHLASDAASCFTLIYGNQRSASAMFLEELHELKDRYRERLAIMHLFSRQQSEIPLFHGRLDDAKLRALLPATVPISRIDQVLVCGPEGLIEAVERVLPTLGIEPSRIHSERFISNTTKTVAKNVQNSPTCSLKTSKNSQNIPLRLTVDGKAHELTLGDDQTVLDAALDAGLDLPYSCKAGVCCTCRAKLKTGSVHMDKCFTLEPDEIAAGFILTCQAKATSQALAVDFDVR